MKVSATVEFTDVDRGLIARFLGKDGLASHIECVAWVRQQALTSVRVLAEAERLRNFARACGNQPYAD